MRLVGLPAIVAAFAATAAAAAGPGASAGPLAMNQTRVLVRGQSPEPRPGGVSLRPGELLLELDVDGIARSRADKVTLSIPLVSTGGTSAEARRINQALGARALAAARSAGIGEADATIVPRRSRGFPGNDAIESMLAAQNPERTHGASTFLEIRLRDPSRFEALRDALEAAGVEDVPDPQFSLADDGAARRSAKADALQRASEEAEIYARNLGMRVDHMLRVSERVSLNFGDYDSAQTLYLRMLGLAGAEGGEVETRVRLAVDFALSR